MQHDAHFDRAIRRIRDDRSLISRATIAILACILIAAGGSGYHFGSLSAFCFSAGVVALLGVLAFGRADRRRREHWDALLHIKTARSVLNELEILRQHRRTLREFGKLLCESPAQSYRQHGRGRPSSAFGRSFPSQ